MPRQVVIRNEPLDRARGEHNKIIIDKSHGSATRIYTYVRQTAKRKQKTTTIHGKFFQQLAVHCFPPEWVAVGVIFFGRCAEVGLWKGGVKIAFRRAAHSSWHTQKVMPLPAT